VSEEAGSAEDAAEADADPSASIENVTRDEAGDGDDLNKDMSPLDYARECELDDADDSEPAEVGADSSEPAKKNSPRYPPRERCRPARYGFCNVAEATNKGYARDNPTGRGKAASSSASVSRHHQTKSGHTTSKH
jgi:hypothetical protein